MKSAIDQLLENAVVCGVAPGVVALAADAEGVFYEGAFGRNGPRADAPVRLDAVFRIASMTKAVTTVAVMQLVEQGRLALDQPMREIVPELGEARVLLGFDADGTPRMRAPRREITLRHLLTHTSGYSYDIFNRDVARTMEHEGLPSIRSGRYAALRAPLLFDPGDRWEYGIGLDWVGRIVEIVSGKPLGMRDTSFMLREDMESRLVSLMARGPGGGLSEVERRSPAEVDFNSGGSGLYSTGLDYVRFTRMLLGGGALDAVRVLAPQTVALMGQNAVGDIEVPAFKSDDPALARSSEQWPGQIKRWGLSFLLNTEDVKGGRGAGSMTWGGVYNTNFWIDPKRQLTAVLMMQILPSGDPQVVETLERYEQALYAGRR